MRRSSSSIKVIDLILGSPKSISSKPALELLSLLIVKTPSGSNLLSLSLCPQYVKHCRQIKKFYNILFKP